MSIKSKYVELFKVLREKRIEVTIKSLSENSFGGFLSTVADDYVTIKINDKEEVLVVNSSIVAVYYNPTELSRL